jgi:hypothetical protein
VFLEQKVPQVRNAQLFGLPFAFFYVMAQRQKAMLGEEIINLPIIFSVS